MTGPEGSGKTTLLYQMILRKKEWRATPTIGFNYEELSSERGDRAGIWDIGGSASVCINIIIVKNNSLDSNADVFYLQKRTFFWTTVRDKH